MNTEQEKKYTNMYVDLNEMVIVKLEKDVSRSITPTSQ